MAMLQDIKHTEVSSMEEHEPESAEHAVANYACRICRRVLFTANDLEGHQAAKQHFTIRKHKGKEMRSGCLSYFLAEKPDWMGEMEEVEGKILCPNTTCSARLGTYKWTGSQCSCGTWVTPAIQMPKSKIDIKLVSTQGVSINPGMTVTKPANPLPAGTESTNQTHASDSVSTGKSAMDEDYLGATFAAAVNLQEETEEKRDPPPV